LIHSREQLDAGALARAILTKERKHLSRNEIGLWCESLERSIVAGKLVE
jgi:hypothetical protein